MSDKAADKTPGQAACESWVDSSPSWMPGWGSLNDQDRQRWEDAAEAAIRAGQPQVFAVQMNEDGTAVIVRPGAEDAAPPAEEAPQP